MFDGRSFATASFDVRSFEFGVAVVVPSVLGVRGQPIVQDGRRPDLAVMLRPAVTDESGRVSAIAADRAAQVSPAGRPSAVETQRSAAPVAARASAPSGARRNNRSKGCR